MSSASSDQTAGGQTASPGAAVRLSVVIVTYNEREAIARTIPALVAQLELGDELIVSDNASTDGTTELVAEIAPAARIVQNGGNIGFAAACNSGAAAAGGELLLLLNPDAMPAPGFVEAIKRPAADGSGWAAWMGLMTADGGATLNCAGGEMHFTGLAWAGLAGAPVSAAPQDRREIPWVSGGCFAIPLASWRRLGGFPPEFFIYQEDVDLSMRLRLEGGRLGLEPAAVVDHDYEFMKNAEKWRRLERNRWAMIIRTYPPALLVAVAPALIATELALIFVAAAGGWLPKKVEAWGDTLKALPRLLGERRRIQAGRRADAGDLAAWMTPALSSAYLGRAGGLAPLRWALAAYWRLATRFLAVGAKS
jgi:GT2 family glycosyltransferase